MAETLQITDTRTSPFKLSDIGYKDGDLTTLKALAKDMASVKDLLGDEYIPVKWIRKYARDWCPDAIGIFDYMIDYFKEEVK